jgi:hypothetical protein
MMCLRGMCWPVQWIDWLNRSICLPNAKICGLGNGDAQIIDEGEKVWLDFPLLSLLSDCSFDPISEIIVTITIYPVIS